MPEDRDDDPSAQGAATPGERTAIDGRGDREDQQALRALGPAVGPQGSNQGVATMGVGAATLFEQAMAQTRMAMCLSDTNQPDDPIVFVNHAFLELTGYESHEIVGRNCRFLQSPPEGVVPTGETPLHMSDDNGPALAKLRDGMAREETVVVELTNYRKDGTRFINALHVGPVHDAEGNLTHYYGSQWNMTELIHERDRTARMDAVMQELQHRLGNLFAIIVSIVRLSAREEAAREDGDIGRATALACDRILALGRAHEATIRRVDSSAAVPADLHTLVEMVLRPYRTASEARIAVVGSSIELPGRVVTPTGLVLHELATNAVKYGALGDAGGTVLVDWKVVGDAEPRLEITWRETGGPKVERASERKDGSGTRILRGALASVDGTMDTGWDEDGVKVAVSMRLAN